MSIFGNIMNKIFHHPAQRAPRPIRACASRRRRPDSAAPPPRLRPGRAHADGRCRRGAQRDGVDEGRRRQLPESIVDLLKLLDLNSSLDARKQLGQELGVHAGADGSAEENIALHKAVMAKLAENGGVVPDSLRD